MAILPLMIIGCKSVRQRLVDIDTKIANTKYSMYILDEKIDSLSADSLSNDTMYKKMINMNTDSVINILTQQRQKLFDDANTRYRKRVGHPYKLKHFFSSDEIATINDVLQWSDRVYHTDLLTGESYLVDLNDMAMELINRHNVFAEFQNGFTIDDANVPQIVFKNQHLNDLIQRNENDFLAVYATQFAFQETVRQYDQMMLRVAAARRANDTLAEKQIFQEYHYDESTLSLKPDVVTAFLVRNGREIGNNSDTPNFDIPEMAKIRSEYVAITQEINKVHNIQATTDKYADDVKQHFSQQYQNQRDNLNTQLVNLTEQKQRLMR